MTTSAAASATFYSGSFSRRQHQKHKNRNQSKTATTSFIRHTVHKRRDSIVSKAIEVEDEDDNEIDNRDIYIPREIGWDDPVDNEEEEDDEQRNIQRNRNENENVNEEEDNDTDVERGEEEIQDFITAHYPVLNSNIHHSDYDAYNNTNRDFPGLIGEPPRIST